jgi:hypothetical protein
MISLVDFTAHSHTRYTALVAVFLWVKSVRKGVIFVRKVCARFCARFWQSMRSVRKAGQKIGLAHGLPKTCASKINDLQNKIKPCARTCALRMVTHTLRFVVQKIMPIKSMSYE